jgi:SAM-dependent methyltransferase
LGSGSGFDFEGLFGSDYLYFYEPSLTPESSDRAAELIRDLLQIESGLEVLDLACGHGRIANRLALQGCKVTGLDANGMYLDLARTEADRLGVEVTYVEGDMRSLPWTERFDRIVNWFTSFGYFPDPENRRVLAEAWRALRPGGQLLIEHMNRDWLLRNWQPNIVVEREGNFQIDYNSFNPLSGCTENERVVIRDGGLRRAAYTIRLFTFTELRDWLFEVGFTKVDGLGPDRHPLKLESPRMIVVAQK